MSKAERTTRQGKPAQAKAPQAKAAQGSAAQGSAAQGKAGRIDWPSLREKAAQVMRQAYAPYSKFPVGAAALVDDGRVVTGCNVENAAYGVTLCAEVGVISQLVATGGGRLVAMSCVDGAGEPLQPCGRCRQLLWEHGGPTMLLEAKNGQLTMAELLPHAFDVSDLEGFHR